MKIIHPRIMLYVKGPWDVCSNEHNCECLSVGSQWGIIAPPGWSGCLHGWWWGLGGGDISFFCKWEIDACSGEIKRHTRETHRISSQSSLSFQPRLPSDTWDTLRTTVQLVNQLAGGQRSTPPSFTVTDKGVFHWITAGNFLPKQQVSIITITAERRMYIM